MLWSMIKIILFVTLVATATLGAVWLLEVEAGLQLTVAGLEFNLGALQSVIAAVLIVVAIWLVFKLLVRVVKGV